MGVKVSIIVPAYNSGQYIRECIDSILKSTLKDIEIILVDDGSTDQTAQICDIYAEKFDRIRVIHQENKGQNAARLTGIVAANGDYIGFVDSDDWIDSKMYEELWEQAYAQKADMVCCGCIYEKGKYQEVKYNVLQEGVYHKEAIFQEVLPYVVAFGSNCTKDRIVEPHLVDKLFRRELILHVLTDWNKGIFWGEDALITFQCIAKADSMVVIKSTPYHYRIHQKSILRRPDKRAITSYPLLLNELLDFCDKNDICTKQVQWYAINAVRDMLRIGLNVSSSKFWQFPYNDFQKGQRIILYGAGDVGICYFNQVKIGEYFAEVIWTDSNEEKRKKDSRLCKAEVALELEYDMVVIAVEQKLIAAEIKKLLLERSVSLEKIYWKEPVYVPDAFLFTVK